MRRSGDVQLADLGEPRGHESGFARPVVLLTAQHVLDHAPRVVHVVPLTTRIREYRTEIVIHPDGANGLTRLSSAQCQHLRAVAVERLGSPTGNVGPLALAQMREVVADLLEL